MLNINSHKNYQNDWCRNGSISFAAFIPPVAAFVGEELNNEDYPPGT